MFGDPTFYWFTHIPAHRLFFIFVYFFTIYVFIFSFTPLPPVYFKPFILFAIFIFFYTIALIGPKPA